MKKKGKLSIEEKFALPSHEFRLRIPDDYNHDTRLSSFKHKNKLTLRNIFTRKFSEINIDENITDENFNRVTDRLAPGENIIIKLIPVLDNDRYGITPDEGISFLHLKEALLVGPHGLTLLYEYFSVYLPKERDIISLDQKKLLWVDEYGYSRSTCLSVEDSPSVAIGALGLKLTPYYSYDPKFGIMRGGDYLLCVTYY